MVISYYGSVGTTCHHGCVGGPSMKKVALWEVGGVPFSCMVAACYVSYCRQRVEAAQALPQPGISSCRVLGVAYCAVKMQLTLNLLQH